MAGPLCIASLPLPLGLSHHPPSFPLICPLFSHADPFVPGSTLGSRRLIILSMSQGEITAFAMATGSRAGVGAEPRTGAGEAAATSRIRAGKGKMEYLLRCPLNGGAILAQLPGNLLACFPITIWTPLHSHRFLRLLNSSGQKLKPLELKWFEGFMGQYLAKPEPGSWHLV